MRIIVKFECVKGTFTNRKNEVIPYETLRIYTLTVNQENVVWYPKVDETSEYEQTFLCGGVRDRVRKWISAESIGEKKGVQVPLFDVISVKEDKLPDLFGVKTFEEFAEKFEKEYFLKGIVVTFTENDYGNSEVCSIEIL